MGILLLRVLWKTFIDVPLNEKQYKFAIGIRYSGFFHCHKYSNDHADNDARAK